MLVLAECLPDVSQKLDAGSHAFVGRTLCKVDSGGSGACWPITTGFIGHNKQRLPAISGPVLYAVGQVRLDRSNVTLRTPFNQSIQDWLGLPCAVSVPEGLNLLVRCAAPHVDEYRPGGQRVGQSTKASNGDWGEGVQLLDLDLLAAGVAAVDLGAPAIATVQH